MLHIDRFQGESYSTYLPTQGLLDNVANMPIEAFIRSGVHMGASLGGMQRYLFTSVRNDALPFADLLYYPKE